MTFTRWLLTRKQQERDDRVGDLARDVAMDREWPSVRGAGRGIYREYLERASGGWNAVLESFDLAYAEWRSANGRK